MKTMMMFAPAMIVVSILLTTLAAVSADGSLRGGGETVLVEAILDGGDELVDVS